MDLSQYYNQQGQIVTFSQQQASRFAKHEAGDFNPLHDIASRRFCVPGDLLFSLLLQNYGVAPRLAVQFDGMVTDATRLVLPTTESIDTRVVLADENGKGYLSATYDRAPTENRSLTDTLVSEYVTFSGRTFPDILVELMKQENVMINPDRPMVIYRSMAIELDDTDADTVSLEFVGTDYESQGKKGEATLKFALHSEGRVIGNGSKLMLLGGLRPYDQAAMDDIVAQYNQWRRDYQS